MTASDIAIIIGAIFAGFMALAQWYSTFQLAKIKATSEAALASSNRNAANIQKVSDKAESAVSHAAEAVVTAKVSAESTSTKLDEMAVSVNGRMAELRAESYDAGVRSEQAKQ